MPILARYIQIRGVVQGVGFRPFVYRAAMARGLTGWVRNGERGVEIHVEGAEEPLRLFAADLRDNAPPAARIAELTTRDVPAEGLGDFRIVLSRGEDQPTVRISPDLPVCEACLDEMREDGARRQGYPYINCTDCGPRHSIILGLPYDRPMTTMKDWPLCPQCAREYHDPLDRRFHAQPVACPACGPGFELHAGEDVTRGSAASITAAAKLLRAGGICAVKGLGGYHLACDAHNATAVAALRERKYRKEKPFALMVRDLDVAHTVVELDATGTALLMDIARPIVLAPARQELPGVAPGNHELGIMLPYTPLHHLLFDAGAPAALVMTSANRSNEPLAYRDDEALRDLGGIADAFLIGQREIARRVDDSVVRVGPAGPVILRRARGYAPGAVAGIPTKRPILAVGPDLKNTIALVVAGEALVSQHIGDLEYGESLTAFRETVRDLLDMYDVRRDELLVAHDAHPEYASTRYTRELSGEKHAVQHHRAHIASVLAERGAWDKRVVGFAFDGTGYGDDGTIWGGEVFVGGLHAGFERVTHLHPALLPGGDAAARCPAQAAAGFLAALDDLPDVTRQPFELPSRFSAALELARKRVRTFETTSMGRLFDTVAALVGFTREITFEGQAAIWLEQLARRGAGDTPYPFAKLDYRPLLRAIIADRGAGRSPADIARRFHLSVADAVREIGRELCRSEKLDTVVLSGGVYQNALLLEMIHDIGIPGATIWTNQEVPPNDGGVSLGQAALAAARAGSGG